MSANTLTLRSSGQTIQADFFNDFLNALSGDLVGRNTSGVPAAGQNLGTFALPFGTIRAASLVLGGSAIDTSQIISPVNRVVSGKKRSTSNQPAFITPNGAAASFILAGLTTNLVIDVNGTAVTVATDITKSGLTLAPSSQNTALINDAAAIGQESTKTWGEYRAEKDITIDTVGTNISALVGKFAAFKNGSTTDYFLAFVESATKLSKVHRGFFYNSSLAPMNRAGFSNNDTLTLMSLAWVFVEDNATTVDVTYNNPTWSFTAPSGPATGDYWYDMANSTWKRYDGATFQIIDRTFVGMVIIDTANCVGARCVDFYANHKPENSMEIRKATTEIARALSVGERTVVAGIDIEFKGSLPTWNITTDLAGSADMYQATEQASTMYYLYLKDDGDTVMSDISPYYRADFYGWYHPHNPWRHVGNAYNNSGSDLLAAISITLQDTGLEAKYKNSTSSALAGGGATVIYTDKEYDEYGLYDTSTGKYICMLDGTYMTNAQVKGSMALTTATFFQLYWRKNGSDIENLVDFRHSFTANHNPCGTGSVKARAGDLLNIQMTQATASTITLDGTSPENNRVEFRRVGNY